jgi:hypothetical protein
MLAFLIVGAAGWGAADLLFYYSGILARIISLAWALLIAFIILFWCVFDARVRSFHISPSLKLLIFLMALFAVPYYFWRSRSRREFCRTAFGLPLFAAVVVPYYVTWYSLRYVLGKVGYYG